MNYTVVENECLNICGLSTEISTSHKKNQKIIQAHWKRFNYELKLNKVVLGKNWTKYGVVQKLSGKYQYMTAIPLHDCLDCFETAKIIEGKYLVFCHQGKLDLIKSSINTIYKNIIPESDYSLNANRSMIHYERYDYRFNWGKPGSVIEIIIPVV